MGRSEAQKAPNPMPGLRASNQAGVLGTRPEMMPVKIRNEEQSGAGTKAYSRAP
jgi:hypothetical protein